MRRINHCLIMLGATRQKSSINSGCVRALGTKKCVSATTIDHLLSGYALTPTLLHFNN
jgi:hypothetical protein